MEEQTQFTSEAGCLGPFHLSLVGHRMVGVFGMILVYCECRVAELNHDAQIRLDHVPYRYVWHSKAVTGEP